MATPISSDVDLHTTRDQMALEIFCLIWLDANANAKETRDTEQKLSSIINHLKKFQDVQQCQKFIEERSENDRLIMIVSGQFGREIVPSIHQLRQVISIYVYCMEKKVHEEWSCKFEKIKAVVTELDELIIRIRADHKIQKIVDEPLSINIFTTGSSITGVNSHFVFAQVLLDCLLRLKSTKTDKKELINHCKQQYHGDSVELSNVHEFQEEYSSEKALWWYTRESFFYKTLNTALRNQNIHIIFLFRKCLSDIQHQLKDHQVKYPLRVYRGQMIFNDELETLKNCQGQFVSVNALFSTSNDRQQALLFLNAANEMNNLKPVLFEIDADPTMASEKPFADISELSEFGGESEILFMLGSIFRLNNVGYDRDDQVWIIRMTLYSESEHDLKQLIMHMKKRFDIGEPTLRTLGKILWEMGKLDLAEQYFIRFLKKLEPKHPLLRSMYEDLAHLASQIGDYDKSLQWHEKLISLENENDTNSIEKPGAPGKLQSTEITNNSVALSWDKPATGGAGLITGYYVEKREQNTDEWVPVNILPCQSTHYTVPSLLEDHVYEFRVIAENEAGRGVPSEPSKSTKVIDPNASVPPEFLKKLKDTEVNEGKTIRLKAQVIGTPKPDVEWFKGTKELSEGPKYSMKREGDVCILIINNATPDDVDEFSIKTRNKGGSTMCRCNVNVRSPPRFCLSAKYQDVLNYDKGKPIVIKIPYTGSPLPNVTLIKDGVDLSKDKNVSIDVTDRTITLTIRNTDKNTSGPHSIKLDNNLGEDEATLRIHVSDSNKQDILDQLSIDIKELYASDDFTTPRLFFILPAMVCELPSINDVTNWFHIHYKLYFICECSDEANEMHIAPHDGYSIKSSKQFVEKCGSYLRASLKIAQILFSSDDLDMSQRETASIADKSVVPSGFNSPEYLQGMEHRLKFVDALINTFYNKEIPSQGTNLREIQAYLELVDDERSLGNLYRVVTDDSHVRWVCLKHYDEISESRKTKRYINEFKAMAGIFDQKTHEGFISQMNFTKDNKIIKIMCDALTTGFYIVKLIFQQCSFYEGYLETLLDTVINRSSIRCLNMTDVVVNNYFGSMKYTCEYMVIEFKNQVMKVRCNSNYHNGNIRMLRLLLQQNKIHKRLDISAFDFLGHENDLEQCLSANIVVTGLTIESSNNINILNAIFNLKKNALCQLKLTHSLYESATSSHFCEMLKRNLKFVEIDLMEYTGFKEETFVIKLLDTLREHKSIKSLNLHVEDIQPSKQIETHMIKSLQHDKFISRLCISASFISHEFIEAFLHASQVHGTLTYLNFYNCDVKNDDKAKLASLYNKGSLLQLGFYEQPRWRVILEKRKEHPSRDKTP